MSKKVIVTSIILIAVIFLTAIGLMFNWNFPEKNSQNILAENSIKETEFLSSTFNEKETYDEIFNSLPKEEQNRKLEAGIISHHFLAKDLIAQFYNAASSDKALTVFLVSPDHFNNYFEPGVLAYTSDSPWKTPFGILEADKEIIGSLVNENKAKISNSTLGLEHGISIEAPFIKKFFPNAKIVPLVFKNSQNYSDFLALGKEIKSKSPKSILIVSSDFSHNLAEADAREKDKQSILALKNISADNTSRVTNDCKQCLVTLAGFLGDDNYDFYLKDNKTSFDISGEDKYSVTSYISGLYYKKNSISVLFTGDLMFDRGISQYAKASGNDFIFDKVFNLLQNNDLVVSNLEGPITNNKSVSINSEIGSAENYFFTFEASIAKTLYENNIKLVNLGNNHILNFGKAGLASTEKYLTNNNVDYFGAPGGEKSIIKNVGGIKIAIVNYNQFSNDKQPARNASHSDAGGEEENTIAEIKRVKSLSDIVILYAHWGDEYTFSPSLYLKDLAHKFADSGADLILGSHSHTIIPMEEYNGKRIYYSLGNFVFDQYFNKDVRNGLAVEVQINLDTKQLQFKETKLYLQLGGQTIINP